jgi:hypothetical protein
MAVVFIVVFSALAEPHAVWSDVNQHMVGREVLAEATVVLVVGEVRGVVNTDLEVGPRRVAPRMTPLVGKLSDKVH